VDFTILNVTATVDCLETSLVLVNGECKTCHRFQIPLGVSLLWSSLNLAGGAKKVVTIFFAPPLASPSLK
jgi:hypothetical protein